MDKKVLEQEEIEKIHYWRLLADQIAWNRKIWACVLSSWEKNKICVRYQNYWKEIVERRINNWTIYQGIEDPELFESSKYSKNVWFFRWCRQHLLDYGISNGRTTIQAIEEITVNAWTEGCRNHETSLPVHQRTSLESNNPQGH